MSGLPHRMKDSIAIICRVSDCWVAMVTKRFAETDPPSATSMRMYCDRHEQEGDVPNYFDVDGKEVWLNYDDVEHVMD